MRVFNERIFDTEVDASALAATAYSVTLDLAHAAGVSAHSFITRSAAVLAGSVTPQKSNDGTNWIDLTPVVVIDAASQAVATEIADAFYRYFRLKFNLTGGTADILSVATTKGF